MWHKGDYTLRQNIITTEFIERFVALNNKRADLYIEHILYGPQKMRGCVPHALWDGERIGFIIEGEERYITIDEVCDVYADDVGCYIKSDVMEIKLNTQ